MLTHFLMASIVSDEKTAVNLIGGPLISEESFFSSFWFQYFLCVFDNQHIYYDVFYHEPFCIYHIQFVELSKCVGYSVRPLPWLIRKGRAFPWGCLVSLRSERRRVFVGLFFLRCLHTSQPLPLGLWFLFLIFIFSKCFVVFTKQNIF